MKNFTQLNEAENAKLIEPREGAMTYLDEKQIAKYIEVANKSLDPEAREVCQWLIDNNSTYMKDFGKDGLAAFYNKGVPTDETLKKLYSNIGKLKRTGKLLEIPVFQTEGEFNDIINKVTHCDEVFLDFDSEVGRNAIAKKFEPLCHKIANNWSGKSSLGADELFGAAQWGLAYAIDTYGKKSKSAAKKAEKEGIDVEEIIKKQNTISFYTYAAAMISNWVKGTIRSDSHLVRIPISQQQKMKKTQGFIPKNTTISGDTPIGGSEDGEGRKLWDVVGGEENPYHNIDHQDVDKLRDEIMDAIEKKFGKKESDLFKKRFGLAGEEKVPVKKLAQDLGYDSAGTITAKIKKITNWILTDPVMKQKASDFYTLLKEVRADDEYYDNDRTEPAHITE